MTTPGNKLPFCLQKFTGLNVLDNVTSSNGKYRMTWTQPQFEEITLGCEINTYASAEI